MLEPPAPPSEAWKYVEIPHISALSYDKILQRVTRNALHQLAWQSSDYAFAGLESAEEQIKHPTETAQPRRGMAPNAEMMLQKDWNLIKFN